MKDEEIIIIDGAEGGGQILRTALALSVITKRSFRIVNIRKGRAKPGLQPQHLEAVQAAAKISDAKVEGATLGSYDITFVPKDLKSGNYVFEITTAGSTSLLLHTIYLPLSFSWAASKLILRGGTHVAWSPTYNYLKECWQWFMNKVGLNIDVEMIRAGFFPHGGGAIEAVIKPSTHIKPLHLIRRGKLQNIYVYSAHTNLDDRIAIRQAEKAKNVLIKYVNSEDIIKIRLDTLHSYSKNTTIAITAFFENVVCCYSGLGERGKPAEKVAEEACQKFISFLNSPATVDDYMADQILLPLIFSRQYSEFVCKEVTMHLETNMNTISKFISVSFQSEKVSEDGYKIKIIP